MKLDKNEVKSKMGFRAKNSKGVDNNRAKCNMGFGRFTTNNQRETNGGGKLKKV